VVSSLKSELQHFRLSVIVPVRMPLVFVDFGLMEQVLHNLLLNATQYSPPGSRIRIKIFLDDGYFSIQVMDRGRGFPTDEMSSVFNKFYRGKDSISGGTGLGLSIVKGFVEAQKGIVTAENRQNGGALFTVKIPVKSSDINLIKETEKGI
jgi:two-component system sensor histidine kinase KdpD